jgi:hypothetical protein
MLSDEEIVKLLKVAYESKLPVWKVDYMAGICKNLQVHTKGLLFSKVDTLFPNEHPDSKAHCINTYEPITKGSIWKAINNIGRIFSNSSFTVSASDKTLEAVNETVFNGKNLFSFFLDKWTENAIASDPNALCAIYPEEAGGDTIRFIRNEHIRLVSKDMVVFISEDESKKTYSVQDSVIKRVVFQDPNVRGGINSRSVIEKTYNQQLVVKIDKAVYHIFTKNEFIRFSLVEGSGTEFDYEIHTFIKPFESIPAFELTAVRLMLDINESFVAPFIPFGNLALLQHRNHRAVDLMFSYPRMSEIQTPCDNLNCIDGQCSTPEGLNVSCSRCGGSGYLTVQSPYKVYQKRIDTGLSDTETIKNMLAASPVDFHTPDVSILNYSKDSWKGYLSMAEEAVFIQQKQQTGHIESGKAKEIDKEGEYSWIQNISKAFNNDLTRAIQAIEDYLGGNATVSIEQPQSFAIVTETEAFETLSIIIESDAPIFIKAQKVENFVHKFVSKSSPIIKALRILKLVDPLLFYSTLDMQTFKSNNVVKPEAWTIHVYAYSTLMNLFAADPNLFESEDASVVAKVMAAIPKDAPVDLKVALGTKLAVA